MFFKKKEPRGPSLCTVLVVGTLATVGAVTIVMRGKEIFECMTQKAKALLCGANSCGCGNESQDKSEEN